MQLFILIKKQNKNKMASITLMPANVSLTYEIADCYVHRFDNRTRTQIAEGTCQVFQSNSDHETPNQQKIYYIKVGDFFHMLRKQQVLVRVKYTGSVCYLLQDSNSCICISFPKDCQCVEKFDVNMGQFLTIVDFSSELLDSNLRQKIRNNCPLDMETADISYDAKKTIRKIGMNIGLVSGRVSSIFTGPVPKNALSSLSDRANRFSEENISENAKTKWNSIKQTSQTINNAMTVAVAPIMTLIEGATESIGKSFNNSNNTVIKTIREYSHAIGQSLNEGVRKGTGRSGTQMLREQYSPVHIR